MYSAELLFGEINHRSKAKAVVRKTVYHAKTPKNTSLMRPVNYIEGMLFNNLLNSKKGMNKHYYYTYLILGCRTCIFFTENFTISSSVIRSITYQILCTSVKYFLSYSAKRQTDGQIG